MTQQISNKFARGRFAPEPKRGMIELIDPIETEIRGVGLRVNPPLPIFELSMAAVVKSAFALHYTWMALPYRQTSPGPLCYALEQARPCDRRKKPHDGTE